MPLPMQIPYHQAKLQGQDFKPNLKTTAFLSGGRSISVLYTADEGDGVLVNIERPDLNGNTSFLSFGLTKEAKAALAELLRA